jgi:hypothetical protein
MVIAVIALFAALGGGYATAFSGSGTLQKAKDVNISSSFTDLRTLNGFGTLQVRCDTTDDEIEYRLDDVVSDGTELRAFQLTNSPASSREVADAGGTTNPHPTGSQSSSTGLHLYKQGSSKAGVDIVASHRGPIGDVCTTAEVHVMALNTVE